MAEVDWVTVGAGFVGALIGGGATLLGVRWQLRSAAMEQADKERRQKLAILKAIQSELEQLWSIYMDGVGNVIATHPDGQAFHYYWPAYSNYFTVYSSNAAFVGHLENDALRKAIVRVYTMAKGAIDSFRMNNGLEERFSNLNAMAHRDPNPVNQELARAASKMMEDYAATLKAVHADLLGAWTEAFDQLQAAVDNDQTPSPMTA
ncbi:hypothetical protein [Cupriavidus pinatubonensis]|uniref:hypothetical protein n=1 Tax=Cupriavidus pinatubonensis TaxID=248026 RepID=UPI003616862F